MKLITIFFPESYLEELDKLVENNFYPSRSEAVRFAVKDLIRLHQSFRKNENESD